MTSERFHKAARDGNLEILKESTKKDCNARDDGGMTPTLLAAFEGHLDALRLLVARGGDPDKADYFGNTSLHLAAARGHEFCVRFLVKFGCNIWSLDIDRHSARELAAINGRDKILQFLDLAQADQEVSKKSKILKAKAEKEAEKRFKEYVKRQKMAEIKAEKEQKKLLKDRAKLDMESVNEKNILPHRPSILTFKGRVKPSPTYSDIVGTGTKRQGSAVHRKALARKAVDDFKVAEIEVDGKKSIRSLTGLRRDSEVMYVGTYETNPQQSIGRRGKISDVWGTLSKARSTPDLLGGRKYKEKVKEEEEEKGEEEEEEEEEKEVGEESINVVGETVLLQEPASIFNRPGFGSVAFRRSVTATLENLPITQVEIHHESNEELIRNGFTNGSLNDQKHVTDNDTEEFSIGSAGSLARRQNTWGDDLLSEEDEIDQVWSPLQRFLATYNISSIHPVLEAEQIDLEALLLLTEADISALKLPLGPRRKLFVAIANYKETLDGQQNAIMDSRL